MSPMPRNPFRGGVRSIARALAAGALAVSVAAGGPALGAAAVLGAGALTLAPQQAWAESGAGACPFEVTEGTLGDDYEYNDWDNSLIIKTNKPMTISLTGDRPAGTHIVIAAGVNASLTLDGVRIIAGERESAISLLTGSSLELTLEGDSENELHGGSSEANPGAPGIYVPSGSALKIKGTGSLSVKGGSTIASDGGTGIGGKNSSTASDSSCGTVVIYAKNIKVDSGSDMDDVAVDIGGGAGGVGHGGSGGTVIIFTFIDSDNGLEIGGGRGAPNQDGEDGQGIRPVPGEPNTYEVWGELALPEGVTIPEGAILTGDGSLAEGSKLAQSAPPAPTISDISQITDTSVTLTAVTGGKTQTHYAWVKGVAGEATPPARDSQWDPKLTIPDLMAATAYTFYARYCETDFYQASPASPGLTVMTAPSHSAVSINYEEETISFAQQHIEVSCEDDFSDINDLIPNGGSITSYVAQKIYARVAGNDDSPIRGVTEISIPRRPPSPSSLQAINVSADGKSDGKITNLTAGTLYQVSTDQINWTDYTADDSGMIGGFSAGDYWVRVKATDSSFKSEARKVTIGVGEIVSIALPTFDPVYSGYAQPDPKPIEIHNSSDEDATIVSVSCTGVVFKIQPEPSQDLLKIPAHGTNAHYALRPEPGMVDGEYASPITVTYEDTNGGTHSVTAEATFTVFPQMTVSVDYDVKPEVGDKDWAPTVTYGNKLEAVVEVSGKSDSGEKPGEEVSGEKAALGPSAGEGPDASPVVPAPVAKGRVSLYFGDKFLAGPVAFEGGEITLTYDTRGRDIPVSEKKQELTVVFEGENAPDETYTAEFKLVKAPAVELTVRGDHVEGSTLEAGFPDARDNAGASFQWLRDGEPIAGATGRRYRLASEDVGHEVTVRATSPWFEGVSASAAHGDKVKPAAPSEEIPPAGDADKPTPGDPGNPAPGNPGSSGLPATGDPAAAIGAAALTGAIATAAGAALARRRNN